MIEQPAKGGSYTRNPDGTLTLIERTEHAKPADEAASDVVTETPLPAETSARRTAKEK